MTWMALSTTCTQIQRCAEGGCLPASMLCAGSALAAFHQPGDLATPSTSGLVPSLISYPSQKKEKTHPAKGAAATYPVAAAA